jgi:transcriptional regulator with XRE-family HTH domain
MSQMPLHELIRIRREDRGWSRQKLGAEVAKREGLRKSLTPATVQQWESGRTAPKRKRITIVADLLGIASHEIVPVSEEAVALANSTPSLEESIRRVALALKDANPQQREVACALLSGLARDPESGQFVAVLSALLEPRREQ